MFILDRWKVRNKNLIVGLNLFFGGVEGMPRYDAPIEALQLIERDLRQLEVRVGKLHNEASRNLAHNDLWYDKIAETDLGKADIVIVGDWRMWRPLECPGNPDAQFYALSITAYFNNGTLIGSGYYRVELPVKIRRSAQRTQKLLAKQGLKLILGVLAQSLEKAPPKPGYRYDTSRWPYEKQVA